MGSIVFECGAMVGGGVICHLLASGGSFAFAMFTLRAIPGRKGSLEPRTQASPGKNPAFFC